MKTVGTMALCRFPLWEKCLLSLAAHADELYLRFDGLVGDKRILERIEHVAGNKVSRIMISHKKWNPSNWREEMLRMLDDVKPDLVLNLDEDEEYGPGLENDIARFMKSSDQQLAFNYAFPMPTIDGWKRYKPFPYKSHVKAYKWRPRLTFIPYKKRARLSNYGDNRIMLAKSKILHYCFYTPEIRAMKLKNTKQKERWVEKTVKHG